MARMGHTHAVTEKNKDNSYWHYLRVIHRSIFGKEQHNLEISSYKKDMSLWASAREKIKGLVSKVRKYRKKITVVGIPSITALILVLAAIPGGVLSSNGDMVCGDVCTSYINYTNWKYDIRVCDVDNFMNVTFDKAINDYQVYLKLQGEWTDHIDDCVTFKQGEVWEFKLNGSKSYEDTVKWTATTADSILDPEWKGIKIYEETREIFSHFEEEFIEGEGIVNVTKYYTETWVVGESEDFTFELPKTSSCVLRINEKVAKGESKYYQDCTHNIHINYKSDTVLDTSFIDKKLDATFNLGKEKELIASKLPTAINKGEHDFTIEYQYPWGEGGEKYNISFLDITIDPNVDDCVQIETSGAYIMTASITNGTSHCINISGTTNVDFDCAGFTIESDSSMYDYAISLNPTGASGSSVENITVRNCNLVSWDSAAVRQYSYSDNFTLRNTLINDGMSDDCIFAGPTSVDFLTISNTTLDCGVGTGDEGLYAYGVDNVEILDSTFTGNEKGIHIYNTMSNWTIIDTYIYDNDDWDIFVPVSKTRCNTLYLTNVTGTGEEPILIYNTTVTIEDWEDNTSLIILCGADNSVINNLTMVGPAGKNNGLFITDSDNINISNSAFEDGYECIHMERSDNNTIMYSTFTDCIDGFSTYDSTAHNSFVINNTFDGSDDDDITVGPTDNMEIYGNVHISTGGNTFDVTSAGDNNLFYNNYIYKDGALNTMIDDISGAGANDYNTSQQAGNRVEGSGTDIGGNYWDNSSGGYAEICTDANNDGFCDDEATIGDVGYIDYLPLSDEYVADTQAPLYSEVGDNITSYIDGVTLEAQTYWDDDDGVSYRDLAYATFTSNETGDYVNQSCSFSETSAGWCNKTIDLTGHADETICWLQYANDTEGNLNESMTTQCFDVLGAEGPRWAFNETNGTTISTMIEFSVYWTTDTVPLSGYIFGWHNGANWTQSSSSSDLESGTQSEVGQSSGGGIADYTDKSCGTDCSGGDWTYPSTASCTDYIIGPSCAGASSCDGTDSVADIWLNGTNYTTSDTIGVTVQVMCYGTGDEVKIWYYNGSTWTQEFYDSTCNYPAATGNYTDTITPRGTGLQYIRAQVTYGTLNGDDQCYTGTYGDNDDISFYIVEGGGEPDNDTNHTAIDYLNVDGGLSAYENIDNITVTVNVTYYNTSGSIANGNVNATLWLEVYNGSDWLDEGDFGTGTTQAAQNYSITVTTSSALIAWETASNRDIRISARYVDYNDSGNFDTINWTDVFVSVESNQEYVNDSWVAMGGTGNWSNVSKTITSSVGVTVKWYVWANSSDEVWNVTDIFSFVTTSSGAADINISFGPPGISSYVINGCSPDWVNNTAVPKGQTATYGIDYVCNNGSVAGDVYINLTSALMGNWTWWASNTSIGDLWNVSLTKQLIYDDLTAGNCAYIWHLFNCSYVYAGPGTGYDYYIE